MREHATTRRQVFEIVAPGRCCPDVLQPSSFPRTSPRSLVRSFSFLLLRSHRDAPLTLLRSRLPVPYHPPTPLRRRVRRPFSCASHRGSNEEIHRCLNVLSIPPRVILLSRHFPSASYLCSYFWFLYLSFSSSVNFHSPFAVSRVASYSGFAAWVISS